MPLTILVKSSIFGMFRQQNAPCLAGFCIRLCSKWHNTVSNQTNGLSFRWDGFSFTSFQITRVYGHKVRLDSGSKLNLHKMLRGRLGHCTKMKFFGKGSFSKCDQSRRKLQIRSHLLRKSFMESFIFCAVGLLLNVHSVNPIQSIQKPILKVCSFYLLCPVFFLFFFFVLIVCFFVCLLVCLFKT